MNINLLKESELQKLTSLLDEANNIVICCHKSPDGDAMGSTISWMLYLNYIGKESNIIVPDAWPDFLQWMPHSETIIRYDKHIERANELIKNADLIFCLDFNDSKRLQDMCQAFELSSAKRVLIDHHLSPKITPDLAISFPDICSTSEIVFRLVWQLDAFEHMSKNFAVAIYVGMMTDTGAFTYSSTYPEIYFIISQLLRKHIDKDKIYRKVYNNFSSWSIRLRGYIMCNKLNILESSHATYFALTREDMERFHYIKGDAEGLVNEPLRINGIWLSISLKEDTERDNKIWISMRSVDNYYCNMIAEKFYNGGGHPNAAGGNLDCSMDEAIEITKNAIQYFYEMYNK